MQIKSFIKNVSISRKFMLILVLGSSGFLGTLILQYVSTQSINKILIEVETVDQPILKILHKNYVLSVSIEGHLMSVLTDQNMEELELAEGNVAEIRSNFIKIKDIDPSLAKEIDALEAQLISYFEASSRVANGLYDEEMKFSEIQEISKKMIESKGLFKENQKAFEENMERVFDQKLEQSKVMGERSMLRGLVFTLSVLIFVSMFSAIIIRSIMGALKNAIEIAQRISKGDKDIVIEITSNDESGELLDAIDKMRVSLLEKEKLEAARSKEQSDISGLNDALRGENELAKLGELTLNYLTPILRSQVASLYLLEDQSLVLKSTYAFTRRKNFPTALEIGESLVGQAAKERKQIIVEGVPDDYITVNSSLGSTTPQNIVVAPIMKESELIGVLELGSVDKFSDEQLRFLGIVSPLLAVAFKSAQSRIRLSEMLSVTQKQADALKASEVSMQEQQEELRVSNEELEQQAAVLMKSEENLQNQQEELRVTNEELEQQAQVLKKSEEGLQHQQEELRVINEELEEQTKALESQKVNLEKSNLELVSSREELERKSDDLTRSSQYKSEFLSTMSHELRTPLNSILILSKILSDNKTENLSQKQVGHVEVIHSAGSDLLELINDILDLSKIEEGKLDFVVDNINLSIWTEKLNKNFSHVVSDKNLDFQIELDESLPEIMLSDEHRINQVVKNMISNALKFTEHGGITIRVGPPEETAEFRALGLKVEDSVAFSVIDTGIGIPKAKQELIFEAFQQADGTTSRKFGGTGLGLTISKQLSMFLGGDLLLSSEGEGHGSAFSLVIPLKAQEALDMPKALLEEISEGNAALTSDISTANDSEVVSNQGELEKLTNTLLIVEDDDAFASTLGELASEYGLTIIRVVDGESALELLKEKEPSAIILDVGLPGIDGWEVMDKIKEDPRTADIPVHFMSGHDSEDKAMEMGAIDFLMKPVSADQLSQAFKHIEEEALAGVKRLLVIEDNAVELLSIEEMFADKDLVMTTVSTGKDAIATLKKKKFDCMIMDLDLPDIDGQALMEQINASPEFEPIPVIVYTAKDLSREEEATLRRYASRIILKAGESSDRLISEVSLFLHWLENKSENKPVLPAEGRDDIFQDKRVLVVDDDMRNIYSLSAILEGIGLECELASNGLECLESLEKDNTFDAILMDIMMPEMDGYEAMGEIRKQEQFKNLPIIALTAKAMKEDRQRCLDAGASDYITKPVDTDKLVSLLRVWLSQNG